MKYFIQGLLSILTGLFIFSSCQKSDSIGLDIDPQDTIQGSYREEFNISTATVKDDSLITSALGQYPIGSLTDPVLGSTDASIALGVGLPSSGFSFGTDAELDSAVLVIPYGRGFDGDSTSTGFRITVTRLNERYSASTGYYSTKEWEKEDGTDASDVININSFAWNDSIDVNQIVKGGPDTALRVPPQFRLRLNNLKNKLASAEAANFANATAFQNFLNGLYISAEKLQPEATGGIAFLNFLGASTGSGEAPRIDVYYRYTNSSSERDTSIASFGITGASGAFKHVHPEAITSTLGQESSTVYIQPMGGLKTRITFPDLENLRELGNIAINKAELVIYTADQSANPLRPLPLLTLYQTDIAGQRRNLPDQTSYLYGSGYDTDKHRYVFNISTYVQRVLSGTTEQYPIYIIPSDLRFLSTQSLNITPIATTAARTVLAGKGHPDYTVKLNIYYTRPHQ